MSLTQDQMGQAIFEEIRGRPYAVSSAFGVPANNCSYKGRELIERLARLGFGVRGVIAKMDWNDTPLPKEIIALYPADLGAYHFYVEIMRDNQWLALDPSWDPALIAHGFPIASWDGTNSPGIPNLKPLSADAQAAYFEMWANPTHGEEYYSKAGPFLKATNLWLESLRS